MDPRCSPNQGKRNASYPLERDRDGCKSIKTGDGLREKDPRYVKLDMEPTNEYEV